jgi:hypothetical protein
MTEYGAIKTQVLQCITDHPGLKKSEIEIRFPNVKLTSVRKAISNIKYERKAEVKEKDGELHFYPLAGAGAGAVAKINTKPKLNLSPTSEQLTDMVASVIRENAHYRDILLQIKDLLNKELK